MSDTTLSHCIPVCAKSRDSSAELWSSDGEVKRLQQIIKRHGDVDFRLVAASRAQGARDCGISPEKHLQPG